LLIETLLAVEGLERRLEGFDLLRQRRAAGGDQNVSGVAGAECGQLADGVLQLLLRI
jgi:hypothetical protein